MNLAKQRAIAMGAVRSQLRKEGIDPKTASYWQIESALDALRRRDSKLIVSVWYSNASTHQWIMWKRDWHRWQNGRKN